MLTTISNLLTALNQLLKQNHLLSEDYQKHLLYERLENSIDEDIDRIKEIAIACGYSEDIANAKMSFEKAKEVLEGEDNLFNIEVKIIREIGKIIEQLNSKKQEDIEGIFNEQIAKEGIINMLGDISEKRVRDIYLLRFSSK